MRHYSPGETVERTGFSIDTLRYYERIGLLADVARNASGQRIFTEDHLAWLDILRCLRDTGMPIAQMIRYVECARDGDESFDIRIALLEEHDRQVEQKIAEMRDQQEHLRGKIQWYRLARQRTGESPAEAGQATV
ncbi:MerR family transcriptional regulator [Micromonospora polyrhachis]|uniref:DNA-binding transcriptional MerR regulator n=1 Tax=Micromonospora polyrhachis TaxID=1282883 RepID=A0A7W7WQC5_9ACTN|nr:MerR family transcriptional regulator [Micromonospora polyrhachis]MBB4959342.1 DNA-binding transcriptional MerR regulator [Micromonospora polyrhachis]